MWLRGLGAKPSSSNQPSAQELRENKRKELEAERDRRAKNRNKLRRQIQSAQLAQDEANQAYLEFLNIATDIFAEEDQEEPQQVTMVNYDQATADADDEGAYGNARDVRLPFNKEDVKFWFSQLEAEMLMASVKSQWLKKTILQRNLPNKQKEDVKTYLSLPQSEAGTTIYLDIKRELIRIYAPKPQDSYKKALTRTMTGLPSQLGYQIVDDICKKANKLNGCCCASAALAIWSIQLPVNIRAHISNSEFTFDTYKSVFEAADQVFMSAKQINISAISVNDDPNDETLPAFTRQNQPNPTQVAAMGVGRGGGRSNRGGRGGSAQAGSGQSGGNRQNQGNRRNRGQGQGQGKPRPKRHTSNPPESCCDRHYQHGDQAWYCLKPLTCPWKDRVAQQ